ncbi:MAG TPA: hypothetical protein PKD96_03680 [Candidatus Absconditabacterales bacterium]|nr:hypothetical protein [Candidatus Absconditabacterales bacterium]HMT27380.1 hypothetical protein [Candidatus Absconditabacterales bacterium]
MDRKTLKKIGLLKEPDDISKDMTIKEYAEMLKKQKNKKQKKVKVTKRKNKIYQ